MTRRGRWLAAGLMIAAAVPGWAASPAPASPNQVDRLESLLDQVDRLDRDIVALTKQQTAAASAPSRRDLQAQLDERATKRAELAAEIETLLPAFPELRREWRRRQTLQRSQALEGRLDEQLKRHDSVLERDAINTRLKR